MRHWKMKPQWDWRWYLRKDIFGNYVEADKFLVFSAIAGWMILAAVVGFS